MRIKKISIDEQFLFALHLLIFFVFAKLILQFHFSPLVSNLTALILSILVGVCSWHFWTVKKLLFLELNIIVFLFALFPFYYAFLTSFETGTALFEVNYFPVTFDLSNYIDIFTTGYFGKNILNSVLVAFVVVFLSLSVSVLASYALGRIHFKGRKLLLLCILMISMFPQVAVLSGFFELIFWLGLFNKLTSLVLSYMVFILPFTIWVLTTFMRQLPKELEEAAIIDGCTPLTTILDVFLPLMWPALVATGLLAFIAAWNEFLFALTFIFFDSERTVPVAIALLSGASEKEIPWGLIMAASVIVTCPLVALVLIFQKKIVGGLTVGAVKG
jgi:trehalose/maltose transport system permease protein